MRALLTMAFAVSFLHQPLTLLLTYGDCAQWRRHRRLLFLAPVVAIPVLAVAIHNNFWLLLPVATVWQLFHTQQQRYGVLRMHGRHSGRSAHWLELALVYAPFLAALSVIAVRHRTREQLTFFGGGLGTKRRAVVIVVHARLFRIYGGRTKVSFPRLAVAAIVVLFLVAFAYVDDKARSLLGRLDYRVAVTAIGLLHFVYDGVIWRRPRVTRE